MSHVTPYRKNFADTFPVSNTGFKMQLATGVALPITIPGTANQLYRAKFEYSYTAEIWMCLNATAVVPVAGTATAVVNQEFVPKDEARYVKGGDTLSFVTSTGTPQLGVSFLLVQET